MRQSIRERDLARKLLCQPVTQLYLSTVLSQPTANSNLHTREHVDQYEL